MLLSRISHRCIGSTLTKPFSAVISTSDTPLTIETSIPFTAHNCEPPSRAVATSSSELLTFFLDMALMRRMEIAADSLYKAKLIRGFCHLYDGQEAVAVGMEAAITKMDSIITAYRDHCTFLGRGGTLLEVFAELMGRRDGCSKGKGGSMHFYKKESGFYGVHGIVGVWVGVCAEGQLFEALSIAALWDLPAILVCENNHYGMGTAEWRAAKSPAYYKRGDYVPGLKRAVCSKEISKFSLLVMKRYKVIYMVTRRKPGLSLVDGMDVLAVKQACKFAKEHALKNGLLILEMDTYRYHGHSMSDHGSTYCTRDEISGVRQERDPIERVRKLLLSHDIAAEKELKDIEKEVRKEVDEAIAKAKENPMPDPSDLFTIVYIKGYGVETFGADRKEVRATLP
ncbi:Pyruvate dehydrogenase E1 component subunit alpha, mitochondrial [Glycine soja]